MTVKYFCDMCGDEVPSNYSCFLDILLCEDCDKIYKEKRHEFKEKKDIEWNKIFEEIREQQLENKGIRAFDRLSKSVRETGIKLSVEDE